MFMKLDTMKKLIKYVIMLGLVTLAALSIPKQMMPKTDAILVGFTAASTFVVLDLVMPSINLK